MTEKETVTAREDQPRLGTCARYIAFHDYPHAQNEACVNWEPVATEDQPRPTPPIVCESNSVTYPSGEKVDIYDPPIEKCPTCHGYHRGGCHRKARVEAQGEAPPELPPVHGPFMDKAAEYLREWSDRYVRYAEDAKLDWSGGQAQYHLANFAGRMERARVETGAHPSQDAPTDSADWWHQVALRLGPELHQMRKERNEFRDQAYRLEETIRLLRTESGEIGGGSAPPPDQKENNSMKLSLKVPLRNAGFNGKLLAHMMCWFGETKTRRKL